MPTALRWLSTVLLAGITTQFLLAGVGAFGATDYRVHSALGSALVAVGAIAFSFAAATRSHRLVTSVVLVLLAVQVALSVIAVDVTRWVGALHGLNALVLAAIAGSLTGRLWEEHRTRTRGDGSHRPGRPAEAHPVERARVD